MKNDPRVSSGDERGRQASFHEGGIVAARHDLQSEQVFEATDTGVDGNVKKGYLGESDVGVLEVRRIVGGEIVLELELDYVREQTGSVEAGPAPLDAVLELSELGLELALLREYRRVVLRVAADLHSQKTEPSPEVKTIIPVDVVCRSLVVGGGLLVSLFLILFLVWRRRLRCVGSDNQRQNKEEAIYGNG